MKPCKVPFWMVLRDNPGSGAHKRHETLAEARGEAARLCEKERDRFFILRAVTSVQPKEKPIEFDWKKL